MVRKQGSGWEVERVLYAQGAIRELQLWPFQLCPTATLRLSIVDLRAFHPKFPGFWLPLLHHFGAWSQNLTAQG